MNKIKFLIEKYNQISVADWEQWLSISTIRHLDKDESVIKEGEVSKVCAFVLNGSFKNKVSSDDGEEKILKFSFGTDFLASCESYNSQIPSPFAIIAMEPSAIMVTNNDALVQLCYKNSSVAALGFVLTQHLMQQYEEHLKILTLSSPALRYEYIINNYPKLVNKVSLTDLAKYLYVSREALSRARSQMIMGTKSLCDFNHGA